MIDFILMFFLVLADALWFGIKFAVVVVGSFVILFALFVVILIRLEKRR